MRRRVVALLRLAWRIRLFLPSFLYLSPGLGSLLPSLFHLLRCSACLSLSRQESQHYAAVPSRCFSSHGCLPNIPHGVCVRAPAICYAACIVTEPLAGRWRVTCKDNFSVSGQETKWVTAWRHLRHTVCFGGGRGEAQSTAARAATATGLWRVQGPSQDGPNGTLKRATGQPGRFRIASTSTSNSQAAAAAAKPLPVPSHPPVACSQLSSAACWASRRLRSGRSRAWPACPWSPGQQ